MEAAAACLDFEEARRLRDLIALVRSGADTLDVDTTGLTRQQPGAMGIGSNRARAMRPEGWRTPDKPDPMTKRRNR
jgi:hypothetical protein